jgi:hypothetical protein
MRYSKVVLSDKNTLLEMLDYFCSKINFEKSTFDADAMACMNRLFIELRKKKYQNKIEW